MSLRKFVFCLIASSAAPIAPAITRQLAAFCCMAPPLLVDTVVLGLHPPRRFVCCHRSPDRPLSLQVISGFQRGELCRVFQGAHNVVESFWAGCAPERVALCVEPCSAQ